MQSGDVNGTLEPRTPDLKDERRTSNVERRIMMSLRSAIYFHLFPKIRYQTLNKYFFLIKLAAPQASGTACMKLHEIRCHSKEYLTAETAEYAEIILNFLSQRSPAGA
jgi:hypothetical protein